VVEATKACRIRRTRGDMGRFFLVFAAVFCEVVDFFVFVAVVGLCGGFFAPDWSGSVFGGGVFGAVGDCLSGESAAAGLVDCCGCLTTRGRAIPGSPHRPARASTHHHLRPVRTTVYLDARISANQNLYLFSELSAHFLCDV